MCDFHREYIEFLKNNSIKNLVVHPKYAIDMIKRHRVDKQHTGCFKKEYIYYSTMNIRQINWYILSCTIVLIILFLGLWWVIFKKICYNLLNI